MYLGEGFAGLLGLQSQLGELVMLSGQFSTQRQRIRHVLEMVVDALLGLDCGDFDELLVCLGRAGDALALLYRALLLSAGVRVPKLVVDELLVDRELALE